MARMIVAIKWLFVAGTLVEIAAYPLIATSVHSLITNGAGWDGSGLLFTQVAEILPCGALFIAIVFGVFRWFPSQQPRAVVFTALALGVTNVALLTWSILQYVSAMEGGAAR